MEHSQACPLNTGLKRHGQLIPRSRVACAGTKWRRVAYSFCTYLPLFQFSVSTFRHPPPSPHTHGHTVSFKDCRQLADHVRNAAVLLECVSCLTCALSLRIVLISSAPAHCPAPIVTYTSFGVPSSSFSDNYLIFCTSCRLILPPFL